MGAGLSSRLGMLGQPVGEGVAAARGGTLGSSRKGRASGRRARGSPAAHDPAISELTQAECPPAVSVCLSQLSLPTLSPFLGPRFCNAFVSLARANSSRLDGVREHPRAEYNPAIS
ncbi:unnamed protein product [Lepidochelys kempii]